MLLSFKRPIDQFSWPNFSYFYDLFQVYHWPFKPNRTSIKLENDIYHHMNEVAALKPDEHWI